MPDSNSNTGDSLEQKLEKLQGVVKEQERRIRTLEGRRERNVLVHGGPAALIPLADGGDITKQEKRILNYIATHPNVTKQDVVDHFKGEMARVPVFNTIDNLVRYGIIQDNLDPKNRQTHRLTLNKNSTFYSVLQELNQFKESFKRFVQKINQDRMKILATNPSHPKEEYFELVTQAYGIFDSMIGSYLVRCIHFWPEEFHDRKDVLNKLTTIALARIAEISESLPDVTVENIKYFRDIHLIYRLQGTRYLRTFVHESKKFGLDKEMEPVLDSLWNINREIQEYAYPEPRLFSWEGFEYGKDDWRKLLEVAKKHPNEGLFEQKMPIDGLLNKLLETKKATRI